MNTRVVYILLFTFGIGALLTSLWLGARELHAFTGAKCGSVFNAEEDGSGSDPFAEEAPAGCEATRQEAAALPIAFGVMGGASVLAGILVVAVGHEERFAGQQEPAGSTAAAAPPRPDGD